MDKKHFIQYVPFFALFIAWFTFASPYFLKGRIPFPSSYQVNFFSPWSAYPKFASPVKNNATPDVITQIYPWKHLVIELWKKGQIPLWNPYSFSGTPLLANYQSAALSPFNILFFILPFVDAWSILVLLQPLLAGIFTYLFSRSLKMSLFGALIASVAFMFCGFLATWMMYGTLGYAILFLPLSLYSVEKFYQTNSIYFLNLLAVTIPLSFFSGHFQTSLYFFIYLVLYLAYKALTNAKRRISILPVLYAFFGLLLTLPQLIPSMELYLQSARSNIFQKIEVIPWAYLPTFLAPDFLGNPVTRNDWFGHYAEWNGYIGLVPFILAFFAILIRKNTQTLFFIIVSVVALLLALQTPLVDLMIFLRIPVLSTSAASRIIVLFSFSFALLSGFGYDYFINAVAQRRIHVIFILATFTLIFVTLWSMVLFKLFIPFDKIAIAKSNLIFPTLVFFLFVVSVIVGVFLKHKESITFLSFIIVCLVIFDMIRFVTKWQPFDPKDLVFPDTPVTRFFSAISNENRAIGNYEAEVSNYYKLPSVEGYDPLYIERYGEFISALSDGSLKPLERSVVRFPKNGDKTPVAINLLGIKYIIHKISDGRNVWAFPFWMYPVDQFKLIFDDGKFQIFENARVFPRAFLADSFIVQPSSEKTLNVMLDEHFPLRKQVVLEEDPKFVQKKSTAKKGQISYYSENKVVIKTTSDVSSLLFLTLPYYSGWKANVDGVVTHIYRADYAFQAVVVPEGLHTVQFSYEPASFKLGLGGAALGFFGMCGVSCMLVIHSKRKSKKKK